MLAHRRAIGKHRAERSRSSHLMYYSVRSLFGTLSKPVKDVFVSFDTDDSVTGGGVEVPGVLEA